MKNKLEKIFSVALAAFTVSLALPFAACKTKTDDSDKTFGEAEFRTYDIRDIENRKRARRMETEDG